MTERFDAPGQELLAALDPDRADPGYWYRFHRWVVAAAAPELARRRRAAGATVGDVILSWRRTLVPAALVTVLLAATMLLRGRPGPAPVTYVDMTEVLAEGVEMPDMPSFEIAAPDGAIEIANEIY